MQIRYVSVILDRVDRGRLIGGVITVTGHPAANYRIRNGFVATLFAMAANG